MLDGSLATSATEISENAYLDIIFLLSSSVMPTTSLTLLDRLRRPGQTDAWDLFVRLYAPLLLHWAELQGFQEADAEDLSQTVLLKLIRLLPGYERREGHSF